MCTPTGSQSRSRRRRLGTPRRPGTRTRKHEGVAEFVETARREMQGRRGRPAAEKGEPKGKPSAPSVSSGLPHDEALRSVRRDKRRMPRRQRFVTTSETHSEPWGFADEGKNCISGARGPSRPRPCWRGAPVAPLLSSALGRLPWCALERATAFQLRAGTKCRPPRHFFTVT